MTAIATLQKTSVAKPFMWLTKQGVFVLPQRMETTHLFYTLRMIWNHTQPKEIQLPTGGRYSFDSFYTKDYMISAISALSRELVKRNDLPANLQRELDYMVSVATQRRIGEPA